MLHQCSILVDLQYYYMAKLYNSSIPSDYYMYCSNENSNTDGLLATHTAILTLKHSSSCKYAGFCTIIKLSMSTTRISTRDTAIPYPAYVVYVLTYM